MDQARWQQIERLYHAALARPAADDEPSGGGGEVCCWTTRMLKVTVTP
jgi:hypothetical protein